jgi:hypothetical protein
MRWVLLIRLSADVPIVNAQALQATEGFLCASITHLRPAFNKFYFDSRNSIENKKQAKAFPLAGTLQLALYS